MRMMGTSSKLPKTSRIANRSKRRKLPVLTAMKADAMTHQIWDNPRYRSARLTPMNSVTSVSALSRKRSMTLKAPQNFPKRSKFGFESPEFSGKVIAALYEDPDLMSLSGKTLLTAEIANRYGLSDIEGFDPKSLRSSYGGPHHAFDAH
jgi:hypothetical protein